MRCVLGAKNNLPYMVLLTVTVVMINYFNKEINISASDELYKIKILFFKPNPYCP